VPKTSARDSSNKWRNEGSIYDAVRFVHHFGRHHAPQLRSEYILGKLTQAQRTILDNSRALDVKLEMDRSEYFPGELATVKITVTNSADHAEWR